VAGYVEIVTYGIVVWRLYQSVENPVLLSSHKHCSLVMFQNRH